MSTKWLTNIISGFYVLTFACLLFGCGSTSQCNSELSNPNRVVAGAPAPEKVWIKKDFNYRNGRYTFTDGRYEKVVSKKAYYKRSLRGYTIKDDYPRARVSRKGKNSSS